MILLYLLLEMRENLELIINLFFTLLTLLNRMSSKENFQIIFFAKHKLNDRSIELQLTPKG